jgi:hypothetical protein
MFGVSAAVYPQWAPVSLVLRIFADKPEEWRVMYVHMHKYLLTCDDISCAMGKFHSVVAIVTLTYNYARPSVTTVAWLR